jgi:hypothetical protein
MSRHRLLDVLRTLLGGGAFALSLLAALWAAELLQVTP